ncbi:hypothetical protein VOLCADRAFT_95187 [Volvox carteri f. nagariensis]|uniref:SAP domain-containing protein n=1 Tax=Volvox carteri f. nagariensis TaxID=3068 RepID=D8U6U7_VOLCA|nr:uncharacterized protein VOLCADRAFT_95187 [Volvox carteri f. nagariensis]EFJ44501.1 hypothetical protein VOLCADRAFT_95187 [Volvox carteri f. nagariensis]|eukprot:XP_002954351.1 hypothetical protein VOLCADRAFT_95187 [Volvox carteri f. nagariensis]
MSAHVWSSRHLATPPLLGICGSHRLGPMWVRCDFLTATPGRTAIVPATELSVQPVSPSTATMALDFRIPGMYKFCPLWPLGPLGRLQQQKQPTAAAPRTSAATSSGTAGADAAVAAAAGPAAAEEPAAEEKMTEAAREVALAGLFADRVAMRRTVARLSDSRVIVVGPGVVACVVGLKPLPANPAAVQRLRNTWLARFGLRLPDGLGGFIAEVAASPEADPDDALDVPGCCLWTAGAATSGAAAAAAGGLTPVPPAQATCSHEHVVEQLVKDLVLASCTCGGAGGGFPFWGAAGLAARMEAPPGAEAALAKRQAVGPPVAAAAAAVVAGTAAAGTAASAQPPPVEENTGWTAAVEVVASGFRAAVSLAPAAQVLRRTIDPDISGAVDAGGATGMFDAALAEALYGNEADGTGGGVSGGDGGSLAVREAILERSSDEALRAAAELRAANRVKEKAFWERHQGFVAARKASGNGAAGKKKSRANTSYEPTLVAAPAAAVALEAGEDDLGCSSRAAVSERGEANRTRYGGGGSGTAAAAARCAPRVPQFGSSALGLSRSTLKAGGGAAARALLKAAGPAAAGKKASAAAAAAAAATKAGGKVAGGAAKTAAGTKTKAAKTAKAAAVAATGASGEAAAEVGGAAAAPKAAAKRAPKAATVGADGAPIRKRAKTAAAAPPPPSGPPLAPAAAADAPAAAAACIVQLPPLAMHDGAVPPPSPAAADGAAAVAAGLCDDVNVGDGEEGVVVQPAPVPVATAPPTAVAKKPSAAAAAAAGRSAKAAGGGKRSAAATAAAAVAQEQACAGSAAAGSAVAVDPAVTGGGDVAAAAAAAATAAAAKESRKRTKASDLDLAAVEAKHIKYRRHHNHGDGRKIATICRGPHSIFYIPYPVPVLPNRRIFFCRRVSEPQVSAAAAAGHLSDLTLPEMQCWLRARKAPVSGKKADVEARLAGLLGVMPAAAAAAAVK